MIQTKKIYQQICNSSGGKELTNVELNQLQNHLAKMYHDIQDICDRHGLEMCLAYGNVLGVARHNGWIPWDDDLDIHMPREDYVKFLSEYSKELPSNYMVSSYLSPEGSYARFAKVFDKNTDFVGISSEKNKYSHVFIDIFPIDNVPSPCYMNKIKRYIAFFMMYTATSVQQVENNSREYKRLMWGNKKGRNNWIFRQIWGYLFSFATSQTWHKWIEKFGINNKKSGFLHINAVVSGCYSPTPEEWFFPLRTITDTSLGDVKVPNMYEKYLELYYGNWKVIPEDADKWHHYVKEMYIPCDQNNMHQ